MAVLIENENEQINSALLDTNNLKISKETYKIAKCERCETAIDRTGNPFLRFIFRDKNGFNIVGRQRSLPEDLSQNTIMNFIGKIVQIKFVPMYWKGKYLELYEVKALKQELSIQCENQFFIRRVDNYEELISNYKNTIDKFITDKEVKDMYKRFGVDNNLENSTYENIFKGQKGVSYCLIQSYINTAIGLTNRDEGFNMFIANVFVEAINSVSHSNPILMYEELFKLKEIADKSNVNCKNIYNIVEGTIYYQLKNENYIYLKESIMIFKIRNFIEDFVSTKELFNQSRGVFSYKSNLVRGGI